MASGMSNDELGASAFFIHAFLDLKQPEQLVKTTLKEGRGLTRPQGRCHCLMQSRVGSDVHVSDPIFQLYEAAQDAMRNHRQLLSEVRHHRAVFLRYGQPRYSHLRRESVPKSANGHGRVSPCAKGKLFQIVVSNHQKARRRITQMRPDELRVKIGHCLLPSFLIYFQQIKRRYSVVVAQRFCKPLVGGSNPSAGSI